MDMMGPNLKELRELHRRANNLLGEYDTYSPMTRHESTLHRMSESILGLLDLCGATRDVLLLAKDQLQDLHSAARRTLIDDHHESLESRVVSAHNLRMKKLRKEVARCLGSLKALYKRNKYVFASDLSLVDSSLIVAVHVLREVRVAAVSMADALLGFLSAPAASPSKGSLAARITRRLFVDKPESAEDAGMTSVLFDAAGAVTPLQDFEVELDCIMRRLIHTRVLLLNILNN